MLKFLFGAVGGLFRVAWFVLARATFLTWLVALWATVEYPALRLAIGGSHPAVTVVLALASVLIVSRFVAWLVRLSSGWHLFGEQPRVFLIHHHRVVW